MTPSAPALAPAIEIVSAAPRATLVAPGAEIGAAEPVPDFRSASLGETTVCKSCRAPTAVMGETAALALTSPSLAGARTGKGAWFGAVVSSEVAPKRASPRMCASTAAAARASAPSSVSIGDAGDTIEFGKGMFVSKDAGSDVDAGYAYPSTAGSSSNNCWSNPRCEWRETFGFGLAGDDDGALPIRERERDVSRPWGGGSDFKKLQGKPRRPRTLCGASLGIFCFNYVPPSASPRPRLQPLHAS